MDFKNPTLEAISYHPHMYLYLLSCNREIKYIENESLDKCGTLTHNFRQSPRTGVT